MEQKSTIQYKRQDRSVSPEVRRKISTTLKSYNATHPRDTSYRQNLSNGLKSYWEKIPKKKNQGEDGTTIEDIML